jgi:hypothetical protein
MKLSTELHAQATLLLGKGLFFFTNFIGLQMDSRADMYLVGNRTLLV